MSSFPYEDHKNSQLWKDIETSIDNLTDNQDVVITTQKEYVVGYLCDMLSDRKRIVARENDLQPREVKATQKEIIEKFEGKKVFVDGFSVNHNADDDKIMIKMHVRTRDNEAVISFYNATQIEFRMDSSEFVIEGFEVLDNRENGYSNDVRYRLNDFECGAIRFYFEKYDAREL